MTTYAYTHAACRSHDTGYGHPERPARLDAVLRALEGEAFQYLRWEEAPRATEEQILRVHPRRHLDRVFGAVPVEGLSALDMDTVVSPGSVEAALRAAGAVCAAVAAVAEGRARNAFCAVRPPGHHAEPETAMGFCLFNNIAVGALEARAAFGLERIFVVDFDVHHGNGTQAAFENDPRLFYASTHQFPLYPGTGRASETGRHGNIVNVPLPAHTEGTGFRAALEGRIFPAIRAARPDLVMISAGFDAHKGDPLAALDLVEADFAWATEELCRIAGQVCAGRVVSVLEGGYDLGALGRSVAAHVHALMQA